MRVGACRPPREGCVPNIDWRLRRANASCSRACAAGADPPVRSWQVWPAPKRRIAFRKFLDGLWPEAQAMGVSRATFDAALRGVEPDLALPDLVLPGKSDVKGQAEFTQDAGPVPERRLPRHAQRAGQGPADAARRLARQDRARARRAAPVRARDLGPRDGVRRAQIELLRRQGARHAGLSRPPQGLVPHRAALRAEDARRTACARARP